MYQQICVNSCIQSRIFGFLKIVINLIKIIISLIKFSDQKNKPSSTSIEKLENQIKELRTLISWTMNYVQLANQKKIAVDEFRKNLEKQFDQNPENDSVIGLEILRPAKIQILSYLEFKYRILSLLTLKMQSGKARIG